MRSGLGARDGGRGLEFDEDLREDDLRRRRCEVSRHMRGDAEPAGAMLIDRAGVAVGDRESAADQNKRHAEHAEEGLPGREHHRLGLGLRHLLTIGHRGGRLLTDSQQER